MATSSPAQIVRTAEEHIETARFGLSDLRQRPERARSGLYNAVVFGRMVTFALQNMRNIVPEFDAWYQAKQIEMRSDPLMSFFNVMRTEIEKEAKSHTTVSAHINSFSGGDMARFGSPPPNARGFFIGDQNGGSGWEVVGPDGSIEKYYVDLPPDIGEVNLHLSRAPVNMRHISAVDLVEQYLDRLQSLVAEARKRFVS